MMACFKLFITFYIKKVSETLLCGQIIPYIIVIAFHISHVFFIRNYEFKAGMGTFLKLPDFEYSEILSSF